MGSLSFGKYKLIAELGHGGMADVFLAVQAGPAGSGFRKLTVVKRLRQNLADEAEFVAMLVDEARIAARLNHPNVVQTNEVGNVGSQYFIAMEYLDGQPLHRIQHRSMQRAKGGDPPVLTSDQQYLILMDALAGLHHAHELADYDGTPLDIVHRDMTPQNIFVTYEGQVKVVDFGIAKAAGRASETRQGVVKGKVRYMAPEQAVGLAVSRRADIFAVGIMLWEAALGRRMWKDKDDLQIVHALVSGDLPPMPRDVDPNVPEGIDRVCRKALALRPEERHGTAEELRQEIEHFLAESGKLVDTRRKLSRMLTDLFADKRLEIKSIIEKQLSNIEDTPSSELTAMPPESVLASMTATGSFTPAGDIRSTHAAVSVESRPSVDPKGDDPPTELYRKNERPSRMHPAFFAVGLAVVLASGVGVWKISARPAVVTRPPKVDEIGLHITSTPPGARVSVDGRPMQSMPLDMKVPRDDRAHVIRIEADGFDTRTELVSFATDLNTNFDLVQKFDPNANKGTAAPAHVTTVAAVPANNPGPWRGNPKPTETKQTEPATPATTAQPTTNPPDPTGIKRPVVDKDDPWADKKPK